MYLVQHLSTTPAIQLPSRKSKNHVQNPDSSHNAASADCLAQQSPSRKTSNGENHGLAKDIVIREATQAGYTLLSQYDFVKGDGMDYFLVFTTK